MVTQSIAAKDHSLGNRLLQYYVLGKTTTYTGGTITLPKDSSTDQNLETILGTIHIIEEYEAEEAWPKQLPWLADDDSPEAKKYRGWEEIAGDLSDRVGAATGRTAASTAQGLIGTFVKVPDDAVKARASIAGIKARKGTEARCISMSTTIPTCLIRPRLNSSLLRSASHKADRNDCRLSVR